VSRLVRAVRQDVAAEVKMLLGGEDGLVALHLLYDEPAAMVLHSPRELPDPAWQHPCAYLETSCWCLNSVVGAELAALMPADGGPDCEATWAAMEQVYHLYLGRRR
jgi:hypothetical protein